MTGMVNIYDAKTNLSKRVDRAAAGEEIIIANAGKPKAKLVPYRPEKGAAADRTCWGSPTSPRISKLRCRRKYRNISSRRREGSDRYAHLSVVGSAAAQPPAHRGR